ncbi:type II toxin-antitoxin system RelE/ParE family toxin [Nevskia soli]|uniref:type II toxin-antitoxin system RelE/ParE family toxin n=1 Tax=Nevskia soli TaxID=418856 RepID=UPI0004A73D27|nr:type II toxin-antitoxin system RelE/ParE family toxin [Nevskia soli]
MKVVWTVRAQRRLQEIHDYIAQDQPVNAARWVARVLDRGEQIGEQPHSGRVVPEYQRESIREILEGDYRIIYRVRSRSVEVLSIRHGASRLPLPRQL